LETCPESRDAHDRERDDGDVPDTQDKFIHDTTSRNGPGVDRPRAARLWRLDPAACRNMLQEFVTGGFLVRDRFGSYERPPRRRLRVAGRASTCYAAARFRSR
jgi:hypothetical protein